MNLFHKPRRLVWFSCGAASAVAAKLTIDSIPDEEVEVLYCDTLAFEHPDNLRFISDVEKWIGLPVKILKSRKYSDIFDVFRKTRFLVGFHGAPCTNLLKRQVRLEYQDSDDTHVFGLTFDEGKRIERFEQDNPELWLNWILRDQKVTKQDCYKIVQEAGIELPAMYRLGYNNNNCVGCVKGGMGYWNKIRVDFPEAVNRMAKMEREIGYRMNRHFLDEMPADAGRHEVEDIECGVLCVKPESQHL